MRNLILCIVLFYCFGCAGTRQTTVVSGALNGNWIPVKQEIAGKALPLVVFEKQKLTISDSVYTLVAESTDKGILYYKDGKMDIYGKEGVNTGRHFMAIYKMENNQLTICYNLIGNAYPDAYETTSKPALFLSVFKKE